MNDENNKSKACGVLTGIVGVGDEPMVGITMVSGAGAQLVVLPVCEAVALFDQLGTILDALGALEDIVEVEPCKQMH